MDDMDEDLEVLELIQSKDGSLDAFKNEWTDLEKSIEIILSNNLDKEREVDFQSGELKTVREQLAFARRNVDELVSQQEVLKETIEHINQKRDGLVEREAKNRDEITVFQGYFSELKDALSVGADWAPDQLEQRIVLEKERDFLASKLENSNNQLAGMRGEIDHIYEGIQELECENLVLDKELDGVDGKRYNVKKEAASKVAHKEELEREIHDQRAVVVSVEAEIAERHSMKRAEDRALKSLDASIAKSKNQMEIYISNYDQLYRTLQDNTQHLEKQNASNVKMKEEVEQKIKHIDGTNQDTKRLTREVAKVSQLRQAALLKSLEIETSKRDCEQRIEELKRKIVDILEVEMVSVGKDMDSQEKTASTLRQELDVLRKKAVGSERTTRAMADLIQLNRNGKINLSVEIKVLEEEVTHSKNQIRALLTEKEKLEHDAEVANQQYYTALEELKLQELQVQELNRKITTDQTKLKQKQSMYESVRADRNLYSKQLVDSQEEINSLKRKFRSMNLHIDQMKEEISTKDHLIVKEHFLHHSVDKERELLKNELTKIRKQVQSSEVIIENQRVEVMKLQRIIEEADQESQRQKNELAAVLSERNLLTAQLVKRNAELGDMYQRIKIQRSNLRIGERNFHNFYATLASWQSELQDTVHEHNDVILKLANIDPIRNRVFQLERDVLKERTKTRALMDELETPMNVHRWRILESSDPKRFDKLTQINSLQKQLVAMSDKVTTTDLLVQEKEKVYMELKNVISRQPGPEVEEQVLIYQQTLKDKVKQLAAMNHELGMYIEQVGAFKEEIADADRKQQTLNKQWMRKVKKQRDMLQ